MPAIVDRDTGDVLMFVDDPDEAEAIAIDLRRAGVHAEVVKLPRKAPPDTSVD